MHLERRHFPEIIPDNEEVYISHLSGIIDSVDELAILQVTHLPEGYDFRISPSLPLYNSLLMEEVLKLNNRFGIHLELSKSIKASGVLSFKIVI